MLHGFFQMNRIYKKMHQTTTNRTKNTKRSTIKKQREGKWRPQKNELTKKEHSEKLRATILSKSGNIVPPRVMNPFSHQCRSPCNDNFTGNDRKEIFDSFWQEGNFDRQNLFLLSCVQIVVPKRSKADVVKPKSASRAWYLYGEWVCRVFLPIAHVRC